MYNKIIEQIEDIEDRMEKIKWLLARPSFINKLNGSNTINIIRKSAGILGKSFPKGTAFENNSVLITRNIKHFTPIKEIQIKSI